MKHLDLLKLVTRETLHSLRELRDERWLNMLVTYVVFTLLSALVLTPLTAISVRAVVLLSGQSALTDTEIIFFFLSFEGALAGLFLAAIALSFSMVTYSALLVASRSSRLTLRGELAHIFHTIATRFWQIIRLSAKFAFALITTSLPFLALIWLSFFLLISENDINFYLSERPPSLLLFCTISITLLIALGVLLIKLSLKWFYAIPLVLFTPMTSYQAKLKSIEISHGQQRRIMYWLGLWLFGTPLLISALNAPINITTTWLAPRLADRLPLLALSIGITLALTTAISFLVSFTTVSMLARQNIKMLLATGLEGEGEKSNNPPRHFHMPINQRYISTAAFLLLLTTCAVSFIWLSSLQNDDEVMVIAHRGASLEAPENTLAAIQLAIEAGSDWVEIDVQETADGQVVVFHDSDFTRLASTQQHTWETHSSQLAALDVGSWFDPRFSDQSPPTLQQVLDLCKGKSGVLIELKHYGHDVRLEQRVIDIVEQSGMENEVMVMSLDYAAIQKMRQLRPHWKLGLLSTLTLGDITSLDIDFLGINSRAATPDLVKHAHKNGVEVYVWTVNTPLNISAMTSRGVDGIITDTPRTVHEVLKQRSELTANNRLLLELAHIFGRKSDALMQ